MNNEKMSVGDAVDFGGVPHVVVARSGSDAPEYPRQRITQDRGPSLKFDGRLLATTSYEAGRRDRFAITIEVWETRGGALIGVNRAVPLDFDGHEGTRAIVVEPSGDEQAMRYAIMDLFEWDLHAQTMARKQLKWKLTRYVD